MSKNKKGKKGKKRNYILYILSVVVIVIPLIVLAFVYITTKENAQSPTIGTRFDESLNPAITSEHIDKIKTSLSFKNAESIEINLQSATLRVSVDLKDDEGMGSVDEVIQTVYDEVKKVLPIKKYFTNSKKKKMYDLDIHVYNFIPTDDNTKGWAYKELVKNAASDSTTIDTLSAPRNQEQSDLLLGQQEKLKEEQGKGE